MPKDVFEEDPFWLGLPNDSCHLGPEVAGILESSPLPARREGLAGITGREDMNSATPQAAVEGGKVTPDRSFSQGLVRHPGHESGRRMGFPLDVTYSSIPGLGDVDAEFEPSIACAECKPIEGVAERGTYSHVMFSSRLGHS
jgi:hypothetical protein